MTGAGADIEDPETGPGWSMALPLVAAGAVQFTALFLLRNHMEPNNWGLFLAISAAAVLPLGFALWFGFFRKRDSRGWWKIPLVLWPVSVLALFTGVAVDEPFRALPDSNQTVMVPVTDADEYWMAGENIASESRTVAQRRTGALPQPPRATGDLRELDRIRLDFARQMEADGRDYEAALAAEGYPDLLASDRVRTPADLASAGRRLQEARSRTATYRARYGQRVGQAERRIVDAPISDEARRAALGGFRARIANMRNAADHIWQLEQDAQEAHRGMIELLELSRWRRQGERFVFSDAAAQARFDARLGDVGAARQEQAAEREVLDASGDASDDEVNAD